MQLTAGPEGSHADAETIVNVIMPSETGMDTHAPCLISRVLFLYFRAGRTARYRSKGQLDCSDIVPDMLRCSGSSLLVLLPSESAFASILAQKKVPLTVVSNLSLTSARRCMLNSSL